MLATWVKTLTIFFSEITHIAMRCRRVEFSAAQFFAVGADWKWTSHLYYPTDLRWGKG